MTKQAERLEFLTKKENLQIVMEILKSGDHIRSVLFNQFMTGLKDYLQEHAIIPQDECELNVTKETDDEYAAVCLCNTTLPRDAQYLRYSVEHSADKDCELTLCLAWVDDAICKESGLQSLKSVVQIGELLKAEGLKKGRRWLRYRYIREDESADEFLATVIDDEKRNSLYRQVNDCFWPLVKATHHKVAAANKDISKAIER